MAAQDEDDLISRDCTVKSVKQTVRGQPYFELTFKEGDREEVARLWIDVVKRHGLEAPNVGDTLSCLLVRGDRGWSVDSIAGCDLDEPHPCRIAEVVTQANGSTYFRVATEVENGPKLTAKLWRGVFAETGFAGADVDARLACRLKHDKFGLVVERVLSPTLVDTFEAQDLTDVPGVLLDEYCGGDAEVAFDAPCGKLWARARLFGWILRRAGIRKLPAETEVRCSLRIDGKYARIERLLAPRNDPVPASRKAIQEVPACVTEADVTQKGDRYLWVAASVPGITARVEAQLPSRALKWSGETDLAVGASIICDLERDDHGWVVATLHSCIDPPNALTRQTVTTRVSE